MFASSASCKSSVQVETAHALYSFLCGSYVKGRAVPMSAVLTALSSRVSSAGNGQDCRKIYHLLHTMLQILFTIACCLRETAFGGWGSCCLRPVVYRVLYNSSSFIGQYSFDTVSALFSITVCPKHFAFFVLFQRLIVLTFVT